MIELVTISKDDFQLIKSFCPEFKRAQGIQTNDFVIDWNELMPVVEKIEKLYSEAFPSNEEFIEMIMDKQEPIDRHYMDVIALPIGTPINEVYEAIVKFIKWYKK